MEKYIEIEVHIQDDGKTFFNYWDFVQGNDIIIDVIDGKMYQNDVEITLQDYINILKSIKINI